ncbi:hypothetical protein C2869_07055 [Saccharobesus litoralis]|uniref:Uncharacterized protein n=1 Tax=Saccharobesus litoralis TaxID=2172099 RepID=A0A2S0VPQ7_9ALTE|nr:hypothetical protein [Saccharobesus litoralis]AWB66207.1 hypothetical protein C2869_07055 [Saccharobesus litoralis]
MNELEKRQLEKLDYELGQALEKLGTSAKLVRYIESQGFDFSLRKIGDCSISLWDIREQIYSLAPELKPSFIQEFEADRSRFDTLSKLSRQAKKLENDQKFQEASQVYKKLLAQSEHGHFRRVAEAGLYRVGT